MTEFSAQIASNLRQIDELNTSIRAMNHTLSQPGNEHHRYHLTVQIEVATMRIGNLMFWVKHWMGA